MSIRKTWRFAMVTLALAVAAPLHTATAAPVTLAPIVDMGRDDLSSVQYRPGPYGRSIGPRGRVAPRYVAPRYVAPRYVAPRLVAPRLAAPGPRYSARPYAGRGYGWRPFVGFGAAVIAGAIIANSVYAPRRGAYYDTYDYTGPYYYPSEYDGDPRDICAKHFRSFEWDTGLYTTYHGDKRMCPYLGS